MSVDIDAIVKSYQDLLIIQYADKEKARATIDALVREAIANGVNFQVLDGYDLETAVGEQLDVLGAWVGIDRYFSGITLPDDAFAFGDTESPSFVGFYGFGDTEDAGIEGGTLLSYDDVVSTSTSLGDAEFRLLIKLKIIRNASNHSPKQITDNLLEYFGDDIYMVDNQDMTISYFVTNPAIYQTILIARDKEALMQPVGVEVFIFLDA